MANAHDCTVMKRPIGDLWWPASCGMGFVATVLAVLGSPRMLISGVCLKESRLVISFALKVVGLLGPAVAVAIRGFAAWRPAAAFMLACFITSFLIRSCRQDVVTVCSSACLDGRVAIVTGGNIGIGAEVASGLAARGATVIIACRNQSAGQAVADTINIRCAQ